MEELKIFEAFAGYGSQRMALRNLGVPFESVGVSEIEGDVLLSYACIHTDFLSLRLQIDKHVPENLEEMVEYLQSINVPLDYKTFENKAARLKPEKLKDMYLANKLIKNYGDIRCIDSDKLPDFDLFTYSFPCQDISVAGYQHGLDAGSGTRSSLLWECCKIIEAKRPKYLMMENVKNLVGQNHRQNFQAFIEYLERLGYKNSWQVLNARNYGTPQNRERVFCISVLGDMEPYVFPKQQVLKCSLYDHLEKDVAQSFYLRKGNPLNDKIDQSVSYCLDANYWKGVTMHEFFEKHKRQLVTDRVDNEGRYYARLLTPREAWRLMGCTDTDFDKASQIISNTSLYRQAGNSIVVSVLEAVFSQLLKVPLKNIEYKPEQETLFDSLNY